MTEALDPPELYDSLLDPDDQTLDPPDDRDAVNRMTEAAAVRQPTLNQVLGSIEKDSWDMYRPDENPTREIIKTFGEWQGLGVPAETEEDLSVGIKRAEELVGNDQAAGFLRGLPFAEDTLVRDLVGAIRPKSLVLKGATLNVIPERVIGAVSFSDWQGRGRDGSGEVADDRGSKQRSIDKIFEYATRESELPPIDDARIFLTNSGAFVYSGNSHRAAASKLRGENLQIKSFELWDLRSELLTDTQKEAEAKFQAVARQII